MAGIHLWGAALPGKIRPSSANLRLTHNCQSGCASCDFWKSSWADAISADEAVRLIGRMADLGVRFLYLSGGEPLLRTDLFDILGRAETGRFKYIILLTNGQLLKVFHEEINESAITHIGVSIDALGARNDEIRGLDRYFETALEGAKLLRGKEVSVNTVLTGLGADDMEGLIDVLEGLGWITSFSLPENRMFFFKGGDLAYLWPDEAEVEKITGILKRRLKRPDYEIAYAREYFLRGAPADGPREPPCVRGFNNVCVTAGGEVWSGCCGLPPVGNVLEADLADIVGSEAYRERVLSMLRRECPGCAAGSMESLWYANNYVGPYTLAIRSLSSLARAATSARRRRP